MFRLLLFMIRSRLVWLVLGMLTIAGTAFWVAVVAVAVVMWVADGAPSGWTPDADRLAQVGTPVGLVASSTAVAGVVLTVCALRRWRTRQWMSLYEAMVRDAAMDPNAHLVQVLSEPNAEACGQVLATDLTTGARGSLWLRGSAYPRGSIVCVSYSRAGTQVQAWMTGALWRACTREAARVESRIAHVEQDRHEMTERELRTDADRVVAAAEQIVREHSPG